ncbi:MAG TPA: hypothetical protein VIG36_11970 [Methylocystis sp.]
MTSRLCRRAAFACAGIVSGLCASSRAETPAGAQIAATSIYEGTLIINVVADNESGIPTNARLICGASVWSNATGVDARYSAPAHVTATTVSCNFKIPYRVETSAPATTYLYAGATITNASLSSASPSPQGIAFVRLDGLTLPLPAKGAITTRTLSGVI